MEFIKELTNLGLKDKEAAVYLACLELGPSPVQTIARKSKVVRATTYVVLEALAKRGLVTQYKEGKKTLFAAEPPRQLMRLLEKQQEEIQEKNHELKALLPQLQMVMKAGEGRPSVRYFDGVEGLRAMRREMMMYTRPKEVWYSFTPIDHLDAILSTDEPTFYKQRIAKQIKSKILFTTKSPELRREMLATHQDSLSERRYVSYELFPSHSGMTIFRDRVAIGSFTGKVGGVVLESAAMADMLRRLFELAWRSANPLDK